MRPIQIESEPQSFHVSILAMLANVLSVFGTPHSFAYSMPSLLDANFLYAQFRVFRFAKLIFNERAHSFRTPREYDAVLIVNFVNIFVAKGAERCRGNSRRTRTRLKTTTATRSRRGESNNIFRFSPSLLCQSSALRRARQSHPGQIGRFVPVVRALADVRRVVLFQAFDGVDVFRLFFFFSLPLLMYSRRRRRRHHFLCSARIFFITLFKKYTREREEI